MEIKGIPTTPEPADPALVEMSSFLAFTIPPYIYALILQTEGIKQTDTYNPDALIKLMRLTVNGYGTVG
jgi:hypothetical protein